MHEVGLVIGADLDGISGPDVINSLDVASSLPRHSKRFIDITNSLRSFRVFSRRKKGPQLLFRYIFFASAWHFYTPGGAYINASMKKEIRHC